MKDISIEELLAENRKLKNENKHLQIESKKSKEMFDLISQNINDVIWTLTPQLQIDYVSHSIEKISGHTYKEIMQMSPEELFTPDSLHEVIEKIDLIAGLTKSGKTNIEPVVLELLQYKKDKTPVWTENLISPIIDKQGKLVSLLGVSRNITKRKLTAEKFSKIFQLSPGIAAILSIAEQKFIDVNDSLCKIIDLPKDEIIGKSPVELGLYNTGQKKKTTIELKSISGARNKELRLILKNNEEKIILFSAEEISLYQKNYLLIAGVDITDRKATEHELRISEERFRRITKNSRQLIYRLSLPEKKYEFVSSASKDLLGYTPEEIYKSPKLMHEIIHHEWKGIAKGRFLKEFEYRINHPSGETKWLYQQIYEVKNEDGKTIALEGIVSDITKRKNVESILRESEERFRSSFETSAIGMCLVTPLGQFLKINRSFINFIGYAEEEIMNLSIHDVTHEKDRDSDYEQIGKLLRSEISHYQQEKRYIQKNGTVKWALLGVSIVKDEYNNPMYFIYQLQDITNRKIADQALKDSEEKFRQLAENTEQVLWLQSTTKILYVNPAFKTVFGFSRSELYKNPCLIINLEIPDNNESVSETYKKAIANGKNTSLEYKIRRPDKKIRWINTRLLPFTIGESNELRIVGIVEDITLQKLVLEALRSLNKKFMSHIENMPIAYIEMDNFKRVLNWNPYAEKVFGYSKREVTGKDIIKLIVPTDAKHHVHSVVTQLKQNKGGFHSINANVTKSGERIICEWHNTPMTENNGSVYGWISICQNITQRIKFEKELKRAKEEAEAANRAKSEFLANMSHEIRTPMNAILGFGEILREKVAEYPNYVEYTDGINVAGKNLLQLINDILDLSKIEAKKLEIETDALNIRNLIDEIRQIFSLKIKEKNLEFEVNISNKLPEILLLDETRLRQVLFNLLGNAVKFTAKGKITITIDFEEIKNSTRVNLRFSIADTGIGIPKDQQTLIFEPFRQKAGQKTSEYGGTGLGLTITKRLVEMMNGKITVKSSLEEGSKFTVKLPDVEISSLDFPVEEDNSVSQIQFVQFENSVVLLVEDIKSNRDVIKNYLEAVNIRLYEAENGEIAIKIAREINPDIILMDIQIPIINGFEATSILKSEQDTEHIPIIALTASSMKNEVSLFSDYLRKPISKAKLLSCLRRFLPYSQMENFATNKQKQVFDIETLIDTTLKDQARLSIEVINKLKNKLLPAFNEIKEIIDIKKIESFASELNQTGQLHEIQILAKYSEELKNTLYTFDIERINRTLELFPKIIDRITKV